MDEAQEKTYSKSVSDLVKEYNLNKKVLQIKISVGKSQYVYMIKGKKSDCKIIFDPLYETSTSSTANAYLCHTLDELKQIIEYLIKNKNDFVTYNDESDDIYDQSDLTRVSYNDDFGDYNY